MYGHLNVSFIYKLMLDKEMPDGRNVGIKKITVIMLNI